MGSGGGASGGGVECNGVKGENGCMRGERRGLRHQTNLISA